MRCIHVYMYTYMSIYILSRASLYYRNLFAECYPLNSSVAPIVILNVSAGRTVYIRVSQGKSGGCTSEDRTNTLHQLHTATHCNTLYHAAPHCTTLHHTAPHCITLHHTAPHCTTLHYTAQTEKHTCGERFTQQQLGNRGRCHWGVCPRDLHIMCMEYTYKFIYVYTKIFIYTNIHRVYVIYIYMLPLRCVSTRPTHHVYGIYV